MFVSRFDYHIEKKTVAQTLINLYIIPRLHKEGYFVGILPQCLFFGEEISKKYSDAIFQEFVKRIDKEIMSSFELPKTS